MPITFDKNQSHFRDEKGRFISEKQIRGRIDKSVNLTKQDLRDTAQKLIDGKINIAQFQIDMKEQIKTAHILTSSIGKGGRANMTQADWGKVGQTLSVQYRYLNKFARDIENGKVSDVQILNRSGSYARAARTAYFAHEKESKMEAGFSECIRLINSKEGCLECAEWANKGWIDIDEQPEVGGLICQNFCLCEIEYR